MLEEFQRVFGVAFAEVASGKWRGRVDGVCVCDVCEE